MLNVICMLLRKNAPVNYTVYSVSMILRMPLHMVLHRYIYSKE